MIEVLHVFKTFFPDTAGGIEQVIATMARHTDPEKFRHTVFTLTEGKPGEINTANCRVVRGKPIFSALSCPVPSLSAVFTFRKLAAKADVIVWHYPWPAADLLSFIACDKPSVILYHSDIVRQKHAALLYEPLRRLFFDRADLVVATSPQYARTSPVLTRLKTNKLRTVALAAIPVKEAVDAEMVRRVKDFSPFVLFVGALRYYKGLDNLITAAPKIKASVFIAGAGPDKTKYEDLARNLKAKNVVFLGGITEAQKRALFENAAVFAFPSSHRSEAFGVALAESMLYGVPAVSCTIGTGTSFVNQNGFTGIEVPPNDPDAFATAVNTILNDDNLRDRMRSAARKHWEKELSPSRFGKAWENILTELAAGSKRSLSSL